MSNNVEEAEDGGATVLNRALAGGGLQAWGKQAPGMRKYPMDPNIPPTPPQQTEL